MSYFVSMDETGLDLQLTDPEHRALQGLRLLCRTRRGTVPMYRDFGLDWSYVDKPINIARQLMLTDLREQIRKYLPELSVLSLDFDVDSEHPDVLKPIVEVELDAL